MQMEPTSTFFYRRVPGTLSAILIHLAIVLLLWSRRQKVVTTQG